MKKAALYFSLVLTVILGTISPAYSATTSADVKIFTACSDFPDDNCIESLSATTPDGALHQASLTGIHQHQDYVAGTFWHATGDLPVYKFDGLSFAYGTNTMIFRGLYWPDNSEYCAYNSCTQHNESVIAYLNPYAPGVNNPMFETEDIFHIVLQLPSSFYPTTSMGRAKNIKISYLGAVKTISGQVKSRVSIDFTPIHLEQADFSSGDPASATQATAYEDGAALWLYGRNTDNTTGLGQCAQSGGIDVYSNAIAMSMPFWNSQTKTIDVWTKSPHLTTTGALNTGYIEARIPIEMAKCMWGVNLQGEIQGKIQVSYEDGSPNTVVTMTGNINRDDYLLTVAGFHFSAPIFHLRLDESMQAVSIAAPQPKSTPASSLPIKGAPAVGMKTQPASKKISIICIKGKDKKVVVGSKCPAGYKGA